MMPASSKAGGMALAVPDVCNTPTPAGPVPIPYPNIAQLATATGTSMKVMIENMDTVVETSKCPSSNGDEAGSAGGVVSGMISGEVAIKMGSSKVFAEGKKVGHLLSLTGHNGSNANAPAGQVIAPSQAAVIVAP